MKLGQGNIFRSMCQEFCSEGGVSRPTPRGRLRGLAGGGGFSRPTPRGRLRGLAGGSPGPHPGAVFRPTPGWGCPGPGRGGVSQHALRQTAPTATFSCSGLM